MKLLSKLQKYILVVVSAAIILVSLLFHYSIHIVNAITLQNVPEFGIYISSWRILFEPFLGILLFFNRSFYAIDELQFVLYWVLIIYVVYSFLITILRKPNKEKKKFIARQFIMLPIVVGFWFVFFVIVLFIPLPNNTIINNSPNSILVNTHSHTEYSHDGLISQEGLWNWHKRNSFDAFFITDHNNHDYTFDFVQAQRNNNFSGEPLVMCGEEFSGSNHLSLLGLKSKFSTKGCSDSTAVKTTLDANGAVIVNHWFDGEHKSLEYYRNLGVNGFEIENTATEITYDRKVYQRIKTFCESNNLIMNGGVDFHGYGNVCSLWNAFEIPGWHNLNPAAKEEAILTLIKTRDQSKLDVLLYNDRPYYNAQHLFFRPLLTLFNYFRTLNFFQIISWIIWLFLFAVIKNKIKKNNLLSKKIESRQLVPVLGVVGALFLLSLALVYYLRIKDVVGFTEMYVEYSNLLFLIGAVFICYSGFVIFFTKFKHKPKTTQS